MSGGSIGLNYLGLLNIAENINELIKHNHDENLDDFGQKIGNNYLSDTLGKFRETVLTIRKATLMSKMVDYLVSGDYSEHTFNETWNEELHKLEHDDFIDNVVDPRGY